MSRATISLPVPLSPVTSTVVSARATLPTRAWTLRMVGPTPTRSPMSRTSWDGAARSYMELYRQLLDRRRAG